jgi:hypothetical protein
LPTGGLFNFQKTPADANYLGTYAYASGQGTLRYGNNLQFSDDLKFSSTDTITIQKEEYRKCQSIYQKTIEGRFSYYLPNDPLVNSFPAGQNPIIELHADGTFTDEGLFATILKDSSRNDNWNAAGMGTYEFREFSILLRFSDGRMKQDSLTIPASKTPAQADLIFVGRASLHKL